MKKILSLLISVILAFGCLSPALVFADTNAVEVEIVNPSMNYIETPTASPDSEITDASATKKYNNKTYYSSGKQLYNSIKNNFLARKTSFTIYYLSKGTQYTLPSHFRELLYEIYYNSTDDEISTSSLDGDYLRYNIYSVGFNDGGLDTVKDGYYYYTLKASVSYYNTAKQDAALDNEINRLVNSIENMGLSDYDTVKYIHDYICSKGTYDYDAMDNVDSHKTAFSAYGTLLGGKSVCQGYSNAFYRICKELGFSVRIMASDPDQGCHAWNLIELDGKYYYIDCTWDDEIKDSDELDIEDNYYFLVNYKTLRRNDNFSRKEHTIFNTFYGNDYFINKYQNNIDDSDYDRENEKLLSKCRVTMSVKSCYYTGTARKSNLTVTNPAGETLANNVDFTLSFSDNVNTGAAKAVISGAGEYQGKTFRQFYILPVKVSGISASDITNKTANLKWNASKGNVSGYSVERVKDGKWTGVANTSSYSYAMSSLASCANQYVRIRAYKMLGTRKFYSPYSNTYFFATKPSKVSIKPLKSAKRKITVSWKKAARVTGYEIQYSQNKNMKGAKTLEAASNKLTKTTPKLKKGKKYYVRVRAKRKYTVPSGKVKISYGEWSSKKSVAAK